MAATWLTCDAERAALVPNAAWSRTSVRVLNASDLELPLPVSFHESPALLIGASTADTERWQRAPLLRSIGSVDVLWRSLRRTGMSTLEEFVETNLGRCDVAPVEETGEGAGCASDPDEFRDLHNPCWLHAGGKYILQEMTLSAWKTLRADMSYAPPRVFSTAQRARRYGHKGCTRYLAAGALGTGLCAHQHGDAWAELISGTKKWLLCPPDCPEATLRILGARRGDAAPETCQRELVELAADTAPRPPGLIECAQSPGSVLYVPQSWFHATINGGDTLSVLVNCDMREQKEPALNTVGRSMKTEL
jgi:hypothetical protein